MNNPLVKNIIRFIVLILVQVLVLNNMNLGGYLNPYIYVLFLLLLPANINRSLLLIIAFITGLTIDYFANTLGLHAAASVFLAFLRPGTINLLFRNQAWSIDEIDKSKLDIFAKIIQGTHDFLSFSKLNKQLDNTKCHIYQSEWIENDNMLIFNVCGNRFLHHMVRYLVGTMIAGAQSKISLDYFEDLLNNPQKNVKIFKAPPEGLILTGIDYDN